MSLFRDFFEQLEETKVFVENIKKESKRSVICVNKMSSSVEQIPANRRRCLKFGLFIIKSCDREKIGGKKSDYEEIELEVTAAEEFKNLVPILQKIAILFVKEDACYFLVEEFLVPFNEFKGDSELYKRAVKEENSAQSIFRAGDFDKKNLVYDKKRDKMMFTDVFPTEEHLILK